MRAIEAAADAAGMTYDQLMQNAGKAAADRALTVLKNIPDPRVIVLVGPGNNGGDGLVAGLLIAQAQPRADVRFYLLKDRPADDPYIQIAQQAQLFIATAENDYDKRLLKNMVASSDILLDALFGIGVRLPLRDEVAKVLRAVNQIINERHSARPETIMLNPAKTGQILRPTRLYVLAIDCPSGLDCDSGAVDKNVIPADETITFIAAKPGHFLFPGAATIGELTLADAGVPADFKAFAADYDSVVDAEWVRETLPIRTLDANKGTFGKALIIGGSVNYVGAPGLSAQAAYRSGAGLVAVAAPNHVASVLAPHTLETTWLMLPETSAITPNALPMLQANLSLYDALLIGPGLGREKTTTEFLLALLPHLNQTPLVLDADALNILSEIEHWWEKLPPNTIITPHPGEMARLTGFTTTEVQAKRWALAAEKAAEWRVILVLKGAHTIIASPQGHRAVLPFKNDALATAGTGDVLAGLIVGLLAQGMKPLEAASAGAYIHGLAGEITTRTQSSRSVIAGDVLNAIGTALQELEQ
jgi:NAD(P)H-hydrate epimerase